MKQLVTIILALCFFGVNAQEKQPQQEKEQPILLDYKPPKLKQETKEERRKRYIEEVNPFSEYGYRPRIATLSNGKYRESFPDTIVQIGSFYYNRMAKNVIGVKTIDETRLSEADLRPDIVSRWMNPDPLSDEFPSWSPYNFVNNNPLIFIDPTGLAPENIIFSGDQEHLNQVQSNINSGLDGDYATIGEDGNLSINITDEQRASLTKEQSSLLGTLEKGINLKDADGNSLDVNIGVVSGAEDVFIGNFEDSKIDIADISKFGDNPIRNESDVLQFEVNEQIDKTSDPSLTHKTAHGRAGNLLSAKKGNLRVSDPRYQRDRSGNLVIVNGRAVVQKRTYAEFSDNKTGATSRINFKTRKNNIIKVQ